MQPSQYGDPLCSRRKSATRSGTVFMSAMMPRRDMPRSSQVGSSVGTFSRLLRSTAGSAHELLCGHLALEAQAREVIPQPIPFDLHAAEAVQQRLDHGALVIALIESDRRRRVHATC